MDKNNIIEIANKNNGYLYKDLIKEYGIDTIYITRLVKENKLTKVSRGIYITDQGVSDFMYIMHLKYSNLIFSGETALYLNGLSKKREPNYEAFVPYGTNIQKIDSLSIKYTRKDTFDLGAELIDTAFRNKVKCYNRERCICDLFVRSNIYTIEDKAYAITTYKKKYLNLEKLYEYATELGVLDLVKKEFENI